MLVSFGNKVTEALYNGLDTKGVRHLPHDMIQKTLNKLDVLNSIFRWQDGNAYEVQLTDYH